MVHTAVDVNKVHTDTLGFGDRIADAVTSTIGSWRFIIIQSTLLAAWIVLNVVAFIAHWDPYPFILLNLMLSFQAAYAAPFVMMSQNRQADKDRLMAENDYHCNVKAELEIEELKRLNGVLADELSDVKRINTQQTEMLDQQTLLLKRQSEILTLLREK